MEERKLHVHSRFSAAMLFFVTNRWKLFLAFKGELRTANATVRPWSRDIFRFAVSHEKPGVLIIMGSLFQ